MTELLNKLLALTSFSARACTDQPAEPASACACREDAERTSTSNCCAQRQLTAALPWNTPGKVLYASESGSTRQLAESFAQQAHSNGLELAVNSLDSIELESLCRDRLLVCFVSTHAGGECPSTARWFMQWLEESCTDFRVGQEMLQQTHFAVFGCGDSGYAEDFNKVAKRVHAYLTRLGGRSLLPCYLGDAAADPWEVQQQAWGARLLNKLQHEQVKDMRAGASSAQPAAALPPAPEQLQIHQADDAAETSADESEVEEADDMEDIGGPSAKKGKAEGTELSAAGLQPAKQMLTPVLRAALSKQGYSLIGSHSGVKLCRWTKSMLRGRGGCYKHSFYGIESHRCMEATPSLACANKCVFCWRHHSNPVGREWRWQMDPPDVIVHEAIASHVKMIKSFSGAPGVKALRLQEGYQVKHCALSLVGEPIMYPQINELAGQLHDRGISTFLVTNAQFPDRIRHLSPITQLYVSVDAATQSELKAIDRPLFSDFWERFQECLTLLRDKRQRTVYRLTLVKGWNMTEVANYVKLLQLGQPDFIEIKGVTFCGSSGGAKLTMQNVPYHADVRAFGQALCEATSEQYGLACEHEHSCCVLLARTDTFLIGGRWHTWIDYPRFQELIGSGRPFSTAEYMLPTPEWAVYGAPEQGFDPQEVRVRKVRNHPAKQHAAGFADAAAEVAIPA